jgi:hypothetical protein
VQGRLAPVSLASAKWNVITPYQEATLLVKSASVTGTTTTVVGRWYSSWRSVLKNRVELTIVFNSHQTSVLPGTPSDQWTYRIEERVPRGHWRVIDDYVATSDYSPAQGGSHRLSESLIPTQSSVKQWRVTLAATCRDSSTSTWSAHIWVR